MKLHPVVAQVTQKIIQRSAEKRSAYLEQIQDNIKRPRASENMGCANVAHAFAGLPTNDKLRVVAEKAPNLGIVTAYNDVLSAHAPLERYPQLIKEEARLHHANAQVAGGVPAMCDGVTQGLPGMELSLFSRDVIAMSAAIALSHSIFDAALMLGVCDKIVPGLLIGALQFGHLPTVFVPAGPMTSGLSNSEKSKVREQAAQGLVGRAQLLDAESRAYHSSGTCTFYGTANSNQMLLEAMGLHVPGTAFIHPNTTLRDELTKEAARLLLDKNHHAPIGWVVDERCIVNAMITLLATGGSTNHLIHWVAVARAAGLIINWDDFAQLSEITPLLTHVYPNGKADVNQFQAAGGPGLVIQELLNAGLLHEDVLTVHPKGLRFYTQTPIINKDSKLSWIGAGNKGKSADESIIRSAQNPFSASGGLKILKGNLGRSVMKTSAVPEKNLVVQAKARVFDSQEALQMAFKKGELHGDVVCVVRWQGAKANGMPELHKLTPPLAVLQDLGYQVALVTDGRMSGASGKVPAAIHVSPEALAGGELAKVQDGDLICLDALAGTLNVLIDDATWQARSIAQMPEELKASNAQNCGRELFAGFRKNVLSAEEGACSWL